MTRWRLVIGAAVVAACSAGCGQTPVVTPPVCERPLEFNPSTGMPIPDGGHVHPTSPTPQQYLALRNPYSYSVPSNALLGKPIYTAQCARCHGDDGRGCGPEAMKYQPPPADLRDANYGHDDPYLYWRIHDGGMLADFTTAMPAYGSALSQDDIWRVLTYVRLQFLY